MPPGKQVNKQINIKKALCTVAILFTNKMSPAKASMIKKMSALVRPDMIGSGHPNHRNSSTPAKPESLLQQQQREQQQQTRAPSRAAIADAARRDFVKGANRFGPPPNPPPTSGIPAPPRRANTHPVDASGDRGHGGTPWPESTIGSALDSLGADGAKRIAPNPTVARNTYQDSGHPALDKAEGQLFTIANDGRFTLADDQQRVALAARVQSATARDVFSSPHPPPKSTLIRTERHFSNAPHIVQPQPSPRLPVTRVGKLPVRERESKRSSYVERATGYPPGHDIMGVQASKNVIQFATIPYDDGATKALENKHSTIFQISSDDGMADADDSVVDDDPHTTPKGNHHVRSRSPPKPTQQSSSKYGALIGLQESSMPRTIHTLTAARERERIRKRKNVDLDYDEQVLKRMSYSDLREEPFDHDPAVGNSPARSNRNATALPDRLQHYRHKDSKAQADFFRTLSVDEWEEGGDWFLEQFGKLMGQMKEARKRKRQICREFEAEIDRRHRQVENRMQTIDETLEKMKSEGEIMMKDKVVD